MSDPTVLFPLLVGLWLTCWTQGKKKKKKPIGDWRWRLPEVPPEYILIFPFILDYVSQTHQGDGWRR